MAGRTVRKHTRVYVGGYDFSGYANNIGPLVWEFDTPGLTCFTDAVQGGLPDVVRLSPGLLTGVFDDTATSGLHTVMGTGDGAPYDVTVAIGDRAAPVAGNPVFCGKYQLNSYQADPGEGMIAAKLQFGNWDVNDLVDYQQPWGVLLHAHAAATGANSATGAGIDNGAASALGGYMIYHVTAGDGTATISIDDSADDSSYSALSGATSGEIDFSTATSNIVALGITATVRQYLRWQISLNGATTVTFALAFVRGT